MKRISIKYILTITLLLLFISFKVFAQNVKEPTLSCIYPAGVQVGSEAELIILGQNLNRAEEFFTTENGLSISIIDKSKQIKNINKEMRYLINEVFFNSLSKKLDQKIKHKDESQNIIRLLKNRYFKTLNNKIDTSNTKLLKSPFLNNLDTMSIQEIIHSKYNLFFPRNKIQVNQQLTDIMLVKIKVEKNAQIGIHQIALKTNSGLSNPLNFQIGELKEIKESEPNGLEEKPFFAGENKINLLFKQPILETPILINGTIMPGDVDCFKFKAKKGQKLVINTSARKLIPFLSDTVPGWFDMVVTIEDENGNELAYSDHYLNGPDPVVLFSVPNDGVYKIIIRDVIFRGRQDFIYRVSIGETPFITNMFPIGISKNSVTDTTISGWNINDTQLKINGNLYHEGIQEVSVINNDLTSNSIPFLIHNHKNALENKNNHSFQLAQQINLPSSINGIIDEKGMQDYYKFNANKGDQIVISIDAYKLNSPLDSLIRIFDESGKLVALKDDSYTKIKHLHIEELGSQTHYADANLKVTIPLKGTYTIEISDIQNRCGQQFNYCLNVSYSEPDFELRTHTSHILSHNNSKIPLCIYAIRKNGYEGQINLKMKDLKNGFTLDRNYVIPEKKNHIWLTLNTPSKGNKQLREFSILGWVKFKDKIIEKKVHPADRRMQAFLYEHLLLSKKMFCIISNSKNKCAFNYFNEEIKLNFEDYEMKKVKFTVTNGQELKKLSLNMLNAPQGLKIEQPKKLSKNIYEFSLVLNPKTQTMNYKDNLILRMNFEAKTGKKKKSKASYTYLPSLPISINIQKNKVNNH